VFSFGALLYELITGARAFTGDSTAQILSAVLRDDPSPFDAPPAVRQIVNHCLAKDPDRRFQTMAEVMPALEHLTRGSADAAASIAVLPFANLSADPENEYFGDGLAEEIINTLAQVDGLKVIARTSAFSFKGKPQDVRQIARTLGVSHVLEGSVRRAGDRVRVTAQLIAAADGAHAWSERFDRPMTDVFAMQDDMAGAITTALKGRLSVDRARARQHVPNIEAYEIYLSGRTHLNQFTPEAWSRAKADLDRAMRADPSYGKPHAELALAYFIRSMHFMQPMREVGPLVRAEVTRALELDPTDPQPRFVLGAIALAHDYQWEEAAEHFAESMTGPHVPGHARWIHASLYLRGLGRFEESAAEMARAAEQDPLNATWQAIWAAHLIDANRVDAAMDVARRSIDIDPTYFLPHNMLGEASWAAGLHDEAVAAFERAHVLAPWFGIAKGWLAAAHRLNGHEDRADALLATMGPTSKPLWGRVVYHLLTSELDAAADWYERMIEERDPFALVYARTPTLEALRAHHRWPDLAARMKLPAIATPT
jgi:serine/threonine-protein kinase